ncbi:MAG TPA: SDR family oxidoreductase [Rhizomicrobium sp.]|jgi:enoyl-[acyl-carrier protein] reductase I
MAEGPIMKGRRGLVMGVANNHSIAWGIARVLSRHGAEIAFTYQSEAQHKRLKPLAHSIGSKILLKADVENDGELDAAFATLAREWKSLDFVVHAIAFSDREELKRRYVETSRENFCRSLSISCFSFTDIARRALPLMKGRKGALVTLSYLGSQRVTPNYNVMGVAKAALEASVRYLAADLGPEGIRVNAISAGPMRTLAGSVVSESRMVFKWNKAHSPLKRTVDLDDVGNAALYLLSDMSLGVTGEIHYVDAGYSIIGTPPSAQLKGWVAPDADSGEDEGD